MKLFRMMVLAAGVFALAAIDGIAQEPMPTTLVSHVHRHAEGVVVEGCAACQEAIVASGKVCVKECAPKTKAVYEVKCKEFCVPKCGIFGMLRGTCSECADGNCEVKTKKVLIKKIVPDGQEAKCVLKDAPTAPCATCGTTSVAAPAAVMMTPAPTMTPAPVTMPIPANTPNAMPKK